MEKLHFSRLTPFHNINELSLSFEKSAELPHILLWLSSGKAPEAYGLLKVRPHEYELDHSLGHSIPAHKRMSCLCNIPSNSFGERLNVKTLDQVWLDGGDMTAHSKVYIYPSDQYNKYVS